MALKDVADETLLLCCELFLKASGNNKRSVDTIAAELNRAAAPGGPFKRSDVYRMLDIARDRNLFKLLPAPNRDLEEQIVERFNLGKTMADRVHVVPALRPSASEAVAQFAAEDALRLIKEIGLAKKGEPVGVGFVGGHTVMRVARLLAVAMRADLDLPDRISFHAVCSGFNPREPETAPVTFLGYFTDLPTEASYGAFFAPPAVEWTKFKETNSDKIVVHSRELRDEIDIVVTSLASFQDDHNSLKDLAQITGNDPDEYEKRKVLGDVAYEPFGKWGTIDVDFGYRALTLFSIPDLVSLAAGRDKEVLLVGSPCPAPRCQRTREDSLEPLFRVPELKVWSQVYLDSWTAKKLLEMPAVKQPADSSPQPARRPPRKPQSRKKKT